jgi:hypothetical protein
MFEKKFEQIAKWTEYKIVPLDYEGMLTALSGHKLEGTVLTKRSINSKSFNDFVTNLINRMIAYAKTNR